MSYKPPAGFSRSETSLLEEDQQHMEMFLIQTPKEFDINQLNGVEHEPGQIKDVAVDNSLPGQLSATYQLVSSCMQNLNLKPLVMNKGKTVVGQALGGHLLVNKSYSIECKPSIYTLPNLKKSGSSLVPMPEGLRVRFTPFGSGKPTLFSKSHKRSRESTSPVNTLQKRKRRKIEKNEKSTTYEKLPGLESQDLLERTVYSASIHGCSSEAMNISLLNSSDDGAFAGKHKKKKKDKRSREQNGYAESQLPNGCLSPKDSSTSFDASSSPWNTVKVKKKKNVSFSRENSYVIDTSGDTSKLSPLSIQGMELSSPHSEKSVKGKIKKQRLSSGYSSMDPSYESNSISLPSTAKGSSTKKEKKKHKS